MSLADPTPGGAVAYRARLQFIAKHCLRLSANLVPSTTSAEFTTRLAINPAIELFWKKMPASFLYAINLFQFQPRCPNFLFSLLISTASK